MDNSTFSRIVALFDDYNQNNEDIINIFNVCIYNQEEYFSHNFNQDHKKSDIRSISKTVMAILTGIVSDKYQNFNEDSFIYPIIKNEIKIEDPETLELFKLIQVKHLLTHTVGYDKVLLMRDDIKHINPYNYLDLIVNTPIVHDPGHYYLYSNAGYYLLSVVLEKVINENLLNFAEVNLFNFLNIKDVEWEYYGKYIAGATRLWLNIEDLTKIGTLLLNEGVYNNHYIVSPAWIKYMQTTTTLTPNVDNSERLFRRYAYAKGLWLAKDDNIFFGHGTGGQILAVHKQKEIIIAVTSDVDDLSNLELIVDNIITNYI